MELRVKIAARAGERGGVRRDGTPWRVVSFVFEELGARYPDTFCGDVWDDALAEWMAANVGAECALRAALTADEWQGRWFNRVRVIRAEPPKAEEKPAEKPAEEADPFARPGEQATLDLEKTPLGDPAAKDDGLPF